MYCHVVTTLGVLLIAKNVWAALGDEKRGPYIIIMRSVEDCSPENGTDVKMKASFKIRRVDRTMMELGGKIDLKIVFDDSIKMKFSLDQFTNQGWKENYFQSEFNGKSACSILAEYGKKDIERFYSSLSGGNITKCPIPPDSYEIATFAFDINQIKGIPIFFYNKYRAFVRFHHPTLSGPEVGCFCYFVDIVPKPKRGG